MLQINKFILLALTDSLMLFNSPFPINVDDEILFLRNYETVDLGKVEDYITQNSDPELELEPEPEPELEPEPEPEPEQPPPLLLPPSQDFFNQDNKWPNL